MIFIFGFKLKRNAIFRIVMFGWKQKYFRLNPLTSPKHFCPTKDNCFFQMTYRVGCFVNKTIIPFRQVNRRLNRFKIEVTLLFCNNI